MPSQISLVAKPVTVPTLEGGTGLTAAFPALTSTWKRKRLAKQFNHSELALLSKLAKLALDAMQEVQQEGKEFREQLWGICNPEDESTHSEFVEMNKIKNKLKKLKKEIKTTESILLKIKKQTRSLDY